MAQGRTPSICDDEAIAALADLQAFLRKSGLSATALAHKAKVSPSSALRALASKPPRWTPTLRALTNFINLQSTIAPDAGIALEAQLHALRGTGSASATAAVLRAVADLLEREAAR